VRHVFEGLLRRLVDDPLILGTADRRHLESCQVCRAKSAAMAADSQAVGRLLASPLPPVDPEAALKTLAARGTPGPTPLPLPVRSLAARLRINPTPATVSYTHLTLPTKA